MLQALSGHCESIFYIGPGRTTATSGSRHYRQHFSLYPGKDHSEALAGELNYSAATTLFSNFQSKTIHNALKLITRFLHVFDTLRQFQRPVHPVQVGKAEQEYSDENHPEPTGRDLYRIFFFPAVHFLFSNSTLVSGSRDCNLALQLSKAIGTGEGKKETDRTDWSL